MWHAASLEASKVIKEALHIGRHSASVKTTPKRVEKPPKETGSSGNKITGKELWKLYIQRGRYIKAIEEELVVARKRARRTAPAEPPPCGWCCAGFCGTHNFPDWMRGQWFPEVELQQQVDDVLHFLTPAEEPPGLEREAETFSMGQDDDTYHARRSSMDANYGVSWETIPATVSPEYLEEFNQLLQIEERLINFKPIGASIFEDSLRTILAEKTKSSLDVEDYQRSIEQLSELKRQCEDEKSADARRSTIVFPTTRPISAPYVPNPPAATCEVEEVKTADHELIAASKAAAAKGFGCGCRHSASFYHTCAPMCVRVGCTGICMTDQTARNDFIRQEREDHLRIAREQGEAHRAAAERVTQEKLAREQEAERNPGCRVCGNLGVTKDCRFCR